MCGPPRLSGRPRKEEGAKEIGRIGNNIAVLIHPLDDAKVQEEDEAHTFFPWSYYILASRFSHSTVAAKRHHMFSPSVASHHLNTPAYVVCGIRGHKQEDLIRS